MSLIEDTPLLDIKRRISRLQHKKYVKPVMDTAEGAEGSAAAPDEYKMPEANPDAEGLGQEIMTGLKEVARQMGIVPSHYRIAGPNVIAALQALNQPAQAPTTGPPPLSRSMSGSSPSSTTGPVNAPTSNRATTVTTTTPAAPAAAPATPTFYFANDMSVSGVAQLLSKTAEALTNVLEAIKKIEKANSVNSIRPQTRQDIWEAYELAKPVMDEYVRQSYKHGFALGYTPFAHTNQKVNSLRTSIGQVSDKIVPAFASLAPRLEELFRNYNAI